MLKVMKEVLAVIRMNKINQTKAALSKAGFPSVTAVKVVGRGRQAVDFQLAKAINENPQDSSDLLPLLAQGHRLIPKRMLSLVVPDDNVQQVVDALIQANQTSNPGDGKIFVLPVEDSVRVSSGETGAVAVDEMTG